MKEKRKRFIQVFAIALIMLLIASASYAYFAAQYGEASSTDITVNTSTVDNLTFETGDAISISATQSNFTEGSGNQRDDTYASATLIANNDTNEASANYYLYIKIDTNEFEYTTSDKTAELILTITDPDGNEVTSLSGLTYTSVTDGEGNTVTGFDITSKIGLITIADNYLIESAGTNTQEWNIEVTLVNLSSDQSDNAGKNFSASLVIQSSVYGNTLQEWKSGTEIWTYTSSTTKIVFDDSGSTIDTYEEVYDLSADSDESIMAYLVDNLDDTYTIYIVSDLPILANENMTGWFYKFTVLEIIEGLDKLITSNTIYMEAMFAKCWALESLDLSNFDTSQVTTMYSMFLSNMSLTSLDVSSFDTSQVKDMSFMFAGNSGDIMSLETITFGSGWSTPNVTNMSYMFQNCSSLTSLDLSSFDTSNVTNMHAMFQNCSSLTSLDLSSFDTSNVTNMHAMFYNCSSLTTLDLSSFNTSNVETMSFMFAGYGVSMALTSIIFGDGWDTSNVTTMKGMFQNCANLTELDLSTWNTSKVTDMSFFLGGSTGVKKLTKITFGSGWDTSNVTTMEGMFINLGYLTTLDLSMFDTSNVTTMDDMFNRSSGILTLNLSSATFSQVTSYSNIFNGTNSSITVTVKDSSAYDFITARLSEYNGGTVVIA